MAEWWSIEVLHGGFSAFRWQEQHDSALIEAALINGAVDGAWHADRWAVVFEVCFENEEQWETFRSLPAVRAALDGAPDPVNGVLVYRGRGGRDSDPRKRHLIQVFHPGQGASRPAAEAVDLYVTSGSVSYFVMVTACIAPAGRARCPRGPVATPRDEWAAIQRELAAQESWIMDGDLGPYDVIDVRLQAADTVVFLDFSPLRCAWRAIRRSRERADFWRWLLTYRRRSRPLLRKGQPDRVVPTCVGGGSVPAGLRSCGGTGARTVADGQPGWMSPVS